MNFTLLVVVLLTAIAFVGVVIALSRAISPRSYNAQKFEELDAILDKGAAKAHAKASVTYEKAAKAMGLYRK